MKVARTSLLPLLGLVTAGALCACGTETAPPVTPETSPDSTVSTAGKFDRAQPADGTDDATACDLPAARDRWTGVQTRGAKAGFEGWYMRIQKPGQRDSIAVIVAFYRRENGAQNEGFVEVIDSRSQQVYRTTSQRIGFSAPGEPLAIKVGNTVLTDNTLTGRFRSDDGTDVDIDLSFDGCRHWGDPDNGKDRSTMGVPARIPFIPLKWHVTHLDGAVSGQLNIGFYETRYDNAAVHFEKNWGKAFPKRWIWMQANQFDGPVDVAFVGAGGPILDMPLSPEGFMVGLRVGDEFFKWRTQDLSGFKVTEIDRDNDQLIWRLTARNGIARLEVEGTANLSDLIPVDVPTPKGLQIGAAESLKGNLTIRIQRRNKRYQRAVRYHDAEVFQSTSAALELGGEFLDDLVGDDAPWQ
ncbi:MAG: tocopherol cyclase family protein [Myxococcota bacterium]|nr:tocopherol cyclase family protein [Myxococcota bacterium]